MTHNSISVFIFPDSVEIRESNGSDDNEQNNAVCTHVLKCHNNIHYFEH
jgi:hypothetical protein